MENFNAIVGSTQKVKTLFVNRDKKVAAVFSICVERKSEVRNRAFTSAIDNFYPFLASFGKFQQFPVSFHQTSRI